MAKTRLELFRTVAPAAIDSHNQTSELAQEEAMLVAFKASGNDEADYPAWKGMYVNAVQFLKSQNLLGETQSAINAARAAAQSAAPVAPKPGSAGVPPATVPKTDPAGTAGLPPK